MLDMGSGRATYRLYVSCLPLTQGEAQALGQRLPGPIWLCCRTGGTALLALQGQPAGALYRQR
jgi:hypothetical protein